MTSIKQWIPKAQALLDKSLEHPPRELNELDWKITLNENTNKLAEHLSAFANHPGGGFIVVGIDNKTAAVNGVKPEDISRITELVANIARDKLEPSPRIDYEALSSAGKPVLMIYIQESDYKPVHLKGQSLETSYVRNSGTTQQANRHELANLMLNSKILHWEGLRASNLLSADEVLRLLDHEAIFKLLNRPHPTTNDEILSGLINQKMVEAIQGGFYITNFGAIAAAKDIRQFDDLRRKAIRIVRYKGRDRSETLSEQEGQKGYAIGFAGVLKYLGDILPQHEIISGGLRKSVRVYPELALRELIANALIHQDFMIRGKGPMVEIFDDRLEISNPGRLLKSKKLDRLFGTTPESRNEVLASYFRQYNICEERGSGLLKALESVENMTLPPLKLEEGENYFKVTMYAPRKFKNMSQAERLEACHQHAIAQHFQSAAMTNSSLRQRLGLGEGQISTVSKLIREAQELGLIKQKDPDNKSAKYAKYIPIWA